jgi:uncharacterized protein YutD
LQRIVGYARKYCKKRERKRVPEWYGRERREKRKKEKVVLQKWYLMCTWAVAHFIRKLEKKKKRKKKEKEKERKKNVEAIYLAIFGSEF